MFHVESVTSSPSNSNSSSVASLLENRPSSSRMSLSPSSPSPRSIAQAWRDTRADDARRRAKSDRMVVPAPKQSPYHQSHPILPPPHQSNQRRTAHVPPADSVNKVTTVSHT